MKKKEYIIPSSNEVVLAPNASVLYANSNIKQDSTPPYGSPARNVPARTMYV